MLSKLITLIVFAHLVIYGFSQETEYKTLENIHYYTDSITIADDYINEKCVLDIYYPVNKTNFATVVWFHSGGLREGNRSIPEGLKNEGFAIVAVDYRLFPKAKCPEYIEDAAASVAWVFNNIEHYGGNRNLIILSGHSAGGYLTSMIGLDKKWLAKYNIDANLIAGLIPLSGQTITHFTIREEKGIAKETPVIDEYAPLYHVRKDSPPIILITGDRELEMLGRYEENAYLMRMMKVIGHENTQIFELKGYGHNIVDPASSILIRNVNSITKQILKTNY